MDFLQEPNSDVVREQYTISAVAVNVLAALKKNIDIKYANSISTFSFLSILYICLKILSKRNWFFVLYLFRTFIIIWICKNNFWSCRQIAAPKVYPAGSKQHPQTHTHTHTQNWPLKFKAQFVIKSISKKRLIRLNIKNNNQIKNTLSVFLFSRD